MRPSRWPHALGAVAVVLAGGACGDDEVVVPTIAELESMTVTVDDLGAGWTDYQSRPLTDQERGEMPTLSDSDCGEISDEATAVIENLEWQVGVMATHPNEAPDDYPVGMQQFLLAGDPDMVASAFDAIRELGDACTSDESHVDADGHTTTNLAFDLPDLGDERLGSLTVAIEPSPPGQSGEVRWEVRTAFVRRGAVLMWFDQYDIGTGDTVFTEDEVVAMIERAVDRLA